MRFTRITVDPRQMGGVPCIRGLRMPVAAVVGMVADGMTVDEILKEHPHSRPKISPRPCSTRPRLSGSA